MPEHDGEKYTYLNKIACGTEVHLQILTPTQAVRLKTRLIGVDPNMSVIIAMHNNSEWLAAKQYIREGQKVIVRLMSTDHPDASLVAFKSNIQKLMSVAGRWLLLDYPKEVQQLALREHRRLPVHISAKLLNPKNQELCSSGHLNDLSVHGGGYIGERLQPTLKDKKYILEVIIEGEKKSVNITIKNSKNAAKSGELVKYGVVIDTTTDEDKALSKEFVESLLRKSLFDS